MPTSTPLASRPAPVTPPPAGPAAGRRRRALGSRWVEIGVAVVLLALFAIGHAAAYPGRLGDDPLYNSPHERARVVLAQQWLETGRPTYPLPLHDVLPADIAPALTPRDAGLLDGEVVPKDFAYAVALVAGLQAIDPRLPPALTTISAVALLVATGALGRLVLGSRRLGIAAAVLLAATTSFWSAGSGLLETGATTAALFVAGLCAQVLRQQRSRAAEGGGHGVGLDVVAGIMFGLAAGTHYATVLLAAGAAVAFAWRRDGGSWRRLGALAVAAGITLLPVLAFNAWVYGSPFTDGYSVGVDFLDASLGENTGGLLTLRPSLLLEHLERYVLRWEVIMLLGLAGLGAVVARRAGGGTAVSPLARAVVIGGLPFLVFSGARPLSGVDSFLVNASLMRYLAPVAAVVAVLATVGLVAVGRRRPRVAVALALAVVVGGLHVAVDGDQGPFDVRRRIPNDVARRAAALELVPEDAIVITGRSDKWLWPERATLVAPYLVDEPPRPGDDRHIARRAPTPARLAEVVTALAAGGHDVFMWNEGRWFNGNRVGAFDDLDQRLATDDIARDPTEIPGLWHFDAG